MRLRGIGVFQLLAVLAMLAAGCAPRTEDTGCPAMQRALDEAESQGLLEPLPHSAERGSYSIVLENREVGSNCDVEYRFRISGITTAEFESEAFQKLICGPVPISGGHFGMEDGQLIMEAYVSQWQPTTEMRLVVGGTDCGGVPLTFTHVGRIAQP